MIAFQDLKSLSSLSDMIYSDKYVNALKINLILVDRNRRESDSNVFLFFFLRFRRCNLRRFFNRTKNRDRFLFIYFE